MPAFKEDLLKLSLEAQVDEVIDLVNEIKIIQKQMEPLNDKLEILKIKIEREMISEGKTEINGTKWHAKWVTTNRSSVDINKLLEDLKISSELKQKYTSNSISKYIKITPKKK